MKSAIQTLLTQGPVDEASITAFLRSHTSFPIIEGRQATFVYHGAAEAVHLRHWVYGLASSQSFERVPGTNLWYHTLEIPPQSRVEYKLEVIQDGNRQWIRDPLNPNLAHDPFGANSVAHGQGYQRPAWTEHDSDARQGTIKEMVFTETALGGPRRVSVYLPARFRETRRYPLLIVHDGGDYVRYASLQTVLDNLIHRNEVAPLIVALTHPVDRLGEYPNNAAHAAFIAEQLLPAMQDKFPIYEKPASRCLMGASFGGVAALATAWRYPGTFGRLLLQSGSFAFTDIGESKRGPNFVKVVEFINAFRDAPGKPSEKVYLSCGTYESLIYENRTMVPVLQGTGMEVRYEEARDGHNWENWRDRLRSGLSWLFPGPLWMVYE
jgi:enterochelin esterase family protein